VGLITCIFQLSFSVFQLSWGAHGIDIALPRCLSRRRLDYCHPITKHDFSQTAIIHFDYTEALLISDFGFETENSYAQNMS